MDEDQRTFLSEARVSLGLPMLFYGTLREPRIFEIVVGRAMDDCRWERADLRGYMLAKVIAGGGFPGIFASREAPGNRLDCLVVRDLEPEEEARVAWYEWDEYRLDRFPLADGRAGQAFVPDVDAIRRVHGAIDFVDWSFEEWRAHYLDTAVETAKVWMAHMPGVPEHARRLRAVGE